MIFYNHMSKICPLLFVLIQIVAILLPNSENVASAGQMAALDLYQPSDMEQLDLNVQDTNVDDATETCVTSPRYPRYEPKYQCFEEKPVEQYDIGHGHLPLFLAAAALFFLTKPKRVKRHSAIFEIFAISLMLKVAAATCQPGNIPIDASCVPCSVNTFSNGTHCIDCPIGSYSMNMATECDVPPRELETKLAYGTTTLDASNDRRNYAYYGSSVSLDGNDLLVGAPMDSTAGSYAGKAYFYHRDVTGTWTETQRVLAPDGYNNDEFGSSTSISGDYAMIGAEDKPDPVNFGAVYAYRRLSNTTWIFEQKLTAENQTQGAKFGISVSMSGDVAVIGAYNYDSPKGAVFVYERLDGVWTLTAKLSPFNETANNVHFGFRVAISENVVFVGTMTNSLYIFEKKAVWTVVSKHFLADYPSSVSVSGKLALVGVKYEDSLLGAVIAFERIGGVWTKVQKLVNTPRSTAENFGTAVALSGDIAIIGAPKYTRIWYGWSYPEAGAVSQFARDPSTGQWSFMWQHVRRVSNSFEQYGAAVAISGTIGVGSAFVWTYSGEVRVYTCPAGTVELASVCVKCPVGTDSGAVGSATFNNCSACSPIEYNPIEGGLCNYCPSAHSCNSTNAEPCPPGYESGYQEVICRLCPPGTRSPLSLPAYPWANASCADCVPGYYAKAGSSACTQCPSGTFCDKIRQSTPIRCYSGTYNTLIGQTMCFTCPKPQYCLGGDTCAAGTGGPLCGKCLPGYFSMRNECQPCPSVPWFLIIAFVVITGCTGIMVTVRIPPILVTQMKQFIAFVQSMSLVFAINIDWPDFVGWLKSIFSAFYLDVDIASPECIVQVTWYHKYFLTLAFVATMPLLVMLGVFILSIVRKRILRGGNLTAAALSAVFGSQVTKKELSPECERYMKLTRIQIQVNRLFYLVLSIAYVPLTETAIKSFMCVQSPVGSVLAADTSILCGSEQHGVMVTISGLIMAFIVVIMPISLGCTTMCISEVVESETDDNVTHYGEDYDELDKREILSAIYESYRTEAAGFETSVMLKRAVFVIIIVAASSLPGIQPALMVVFGAIYGGWVWYRMPFAPIPVSHKSHRLLINTLNYSEVICAASVVVNAAIAYLPPSASAAASAVSAITALAGLAALAVPFFAKRQARQSVDTEIADIEDPRVLLGEGDGKWLIALESQLRTVLETEMDPRFKIELVGAYRVWIDRLNGRLKHRREDLLKFHPEIKEFTPITPIDAELYGVPLREIKLTDGRERAMKSAYGTAGDPASV